MADQDAHATARGNAFAATADNPSAIYYNPAGIAQGRGHRLSLGTYGVSFESEFRSPGGATSDTKDKPLALPQLFYTYVPEEKPVAFGLGFYSPYGLSLEWPEDSGFRTLAVQGRVTYLTVNPVVAWRPHRTLMIGGGPTFNYGDAFLRQGVFSPVPQSDQLRFNGDDMDVGFNLGVLWQPHEKHSFGVSYRSKSSINFEGTARTSGVGPPFDGTSAANARFPFPENVIAGWSFRPTPRWNLEFNVDWTDWERLDTVQLNQDTGPTFPLPFNWDSSFFYEWGVTHHFGKGWRLSGGYIFSENSVPDSSFNPLVPDSDRHIFSCGLGRNYEHWTWDMTYQFAHGPARTVSGSPPSFPAGQSADGTYEFNSHALSFVIGYQF